MLQAEQDTIVLNTAQNTVLESNPQMVKSVYPSSYHEILFEKDVIRDAAITDVLTFFNTDLCESVDQSLRQS